MRNSETRLFSEFMYYSLGAMRDAGYPASKRQVSLAHGFVENGEGTLPHLLAKVETWIWSPVVAWCAA